VYEVRTASSGLKEVGSMLNVSDAHHFRKLVAGFCMVCAPLLFVASAIVSPSLDRHEGRLLSSIAGHPDRWYIASLLGFVGLIVFLPAILGLMHMLRERKTAFGHVGGALALIGFVAVAASAGVTFTMWQMARAGDRAQMTALLHRIDHTAGSFIPLMLLGLALSIGMIVLAWGLASAHAAPAWSALCVAVAAVLFGISGATASLPIQIIAAAVLAFGLGAIGWMVLGETDEQWEHTPEVRGFRPAAGTG
jgi:hypothetical protein